MNRMPEHQPASDSLLAKIRNYLYLAKEDVKYIFVGSVDSNCNRLDNHMFRARGNVVHRFGGRMVSSDMDYIRQCMADEKFKMPS